MNTVIIFTSLYAKENIAEVQSVKCVYLQADLTVHGQVVSPCTTRFIIHKFNPTFNILYKP